MSWSHLVETMGFEPTTQGLQTVWTEGLGELSWAPTRTERPGATSMDRVVSHMRGTAAPLDHRGGAGGVRWSPRSQASLVATGEQPPDRQLGKRWLGRPGPLWCKARMR